MEPNGFKLAPVSPLVLKGFKFPAISFPAANGFEDEDETVTLENIDLACKADEDLKPSVSGAYSWAVSLMSLLVWNIFFSWN